MAKKLYIETHGCQMNEYDSSRMVDLLGEHQALEVTERAEDADVILLNTCSIRERAQDRVYSQLGRWRELKDAKPDMVIAVGGCVASQEGDSIRKRAPYVDVVFGPQTLHRLPEMIDAARTTRLPQVDVSFPEIEKFDHLPEPRIDGPTAYVSVMEGCSKYCTFCVVPYTRGEEVSRPFDDVLAEIIHLAENGVREVTLLGQNVNGYRGQTHDGRLADLAELIRVVAAVDGIDRIRYTTSHPLEFSDSLIQAHAEVPELVKHLHLPVQSGSDRVLAAMKRGHTVLEYKSKLRKLKAAVPASASVPTSSSASRRNRERLREHHEAGGRGRLRLLLLVHLQPASGHPGLRPAGRHPRGAEEGTPGCTAAPPGPPGLRDQPTDGRHPAAHPGNRLFATRSGAVAGAHGE